MVDQASQIPPGCRLLAVDPGEKRIGLALSDPSGTIGRPLTVLAHVSRLMDAAVIANLAQENSVKLIIIGQPLDSDGQVGPAARKAARLAEALRNQTAIPVILWDEGGTTLVEMGISRSRRGGHQDALAAALILKSYIDAQLEAG
jgi:putative Holliday junction resolvase